MVFDLEMEVRAALMDSLMKKYNITIEDVHDTARLVADTIRTSQANKKSGVTFMTAAASERWDKMKRGEEPMGPGAKPEVV